MKATRPSRGLACGLLAVSLGLPAIGHAERARTIADVDQSLGQVEADLAELREQLASAEKLHSPEAQVAAPKDLLHRRINDGQVFFLGKDYVRAAIIFYDLVENPEYARRPGHDERVFYLAESMFHNRNFLGARKYYQFLADQGPASAYFFRALPRLVEIASALDEYRGIDKYFAMLKGRPRQEVGEEIYYIHAKSQYDRGELAAAAKEFADFPPSSPFYQRAQYFRGVVAVRAGRDRYPEALDLFRGITAPGASGVDGDLVDLARLAIGRVLLEQGLTDEAMNAYQDIGRHSEHFDEALYEICWAWIRKANETAQELAEIDPDATLTEDEELEQRKKVRAVETFFKKALGTLDLLLAALPDSQLLPQAKLLKGDLLLRLGQVTAATSAYEEVVKQFDPVKADLEQIIAEHEDPRRYFNEIMGRNVDSFDVSSFLPALAVKWAQTSDDVQRALEAVHDLATSKAALAEAERIAEQLTAAAEQSAEHGVLPSMRDGRDMALAVRDGGNDLRRQLAELETEVLLASRVRSGGGGDAAGLRTTDDVDLEVLLRAAATWCRETSAKRELSAEEKSFCEERVYKDAAALDEGSEARAATREELRAELAAKGLDAWLSYEEARAERKEWEAKVQNLPKTLKRIETRDAEIAGRLTTLQQELMKLSLELDNAEAQLKAIEEWRRDSLNQRTILPEHETSFQDRWSQELGSLQAYRAELEEVQDEVNRAAARVSAVGAGTVGDEQEIRLAYQRALEREKSLFQRLRANLDEAGLGRVARIDTLRVQLDSLDADVTGYLDRIQGHSGGEANRLAVELEKAKKELAAHALEVAALKSEAEVTAGAVAYSSFQDVREQFFQLVLRADVGLIDVAWADTEGQNSEKMDLVQQKADEMREVYEQFSDVLEELE